MRENSDPKLAGCGKSHAKARALIEHQGKIRVEVRLVTIEERKGWTLADIGSPLRVRRASKERLEEVGITQEIGFSEEKPYMTRQTAPSFRLKGVGQTYTFVFKYRAAGVLERKDYDSPGEFSEPRIYDQDIIALRDISWVYGKQDTKARGSKPEADEKAFPFSENLTAEKDSACDDDEEDSESDQPLSSLRKKSRGVKRKFNGANREIISQNSSPLNISVLEQMTPTSAIENGESRGDTTDAIEIPSCNIDVHSTDMGDPQNALGEPLGTTCLSAVGKESCPRTLLRLHLAERLRHELTIMR